LEVSLDEVAAVRGHLETSLVEEDATLGHVDSSLVQVDAWRCHLGECHVQLDEPLIQLKKERDQVARSLDQEDATLANRKRRAATSARRFAQLAASLA
jgi:hypothetical protein